ncbi:MAG: cell division protein FtsX [Bdellovibrionales bacterium]
MAPHSLFSPSFRHQKLGWLFTAIVVIMVYIATFAMAAQAALSSLSLSRNEDLTNHLTVEIPAVEDEAAVSQADRVNQAVALLRATPDVAQVRTLSDQDTRRLLEPWISQPELLKKLSLPTLIDVERRDGGTLTATAIESRLRTSISDARVDDHADWLGDLARLVNSLSALAAFMIMLTGVTLMIAIALICRAVMATERETVELLHTMGADDGHIAGHFQRHAWRISAPAALAGFGLAILSLGILMLFLRDIMDISSLGIARWIGLAALVIVVPLTAMLVASLSARFSVLRLLRSLP